MLRGSRVGSRVVECAWGQMSMGAIIVKFKVFDRLHLKGPDRRLVGARPTMGYEVAAGKQFTYGKERVLPRKFHLNLFPIVYR